MNRAQWSLDLSHENFKENPSLIDTYLCVKLNDIYDERLRNKMYASMAHKCTDSCRRPGRRCKIGFPFPPCVKSYIDDTGWVVFGHTCEKSRWLVPTSLKLFQYWSECHVSVHSVNAQYAVWLYMLSYIDKNLDQVKYLEVK